MSCLIKRDGDIDQCILSGRDVQGLKDGIKFPIGDPRGIAYAHRGQIVLGVVHSLGGCWEPEGGAARSQRVRVAPPKHGSHARSCP